MMINLQWKTQLEISNLSYLNHAFSMITDATIIMGKVSCVINTTGSLVQLLVRKTVRDDPRVR